MVNYITISGYIDIVMDLLIILKALSDETRLRILYLLLNHELNVNEIVDVLSMGQSRISRHLKILSDAGILSCRKDGLWAFYTAAVNGPAEQMIKLLRQEMTADYLQKTIVRLNLICLTGTGRGGNISTI
jgi:ArsR family transcriptional regulator